jgi:hypothetical protein
MFSLFFLERFFYMVRKFFNERTAIISTTLLAFSYTYLYYATEFRSYSFVLMLVVYQIYYFNLVLKEDKGNVLYLIFSLLMIYSHYMAGLIILSQLLYLIIFEREHEIERITKIYYSFLWLFALSIPLLIYIVKTIPKIQSFWFNNIDVISLVSTFMYILAPPTETIYGFGLFYLLLFGTMIFFRKRATKTYMQFSMYLFFPIIFMWLFSQYFAFYHHRYFLFGGVAFFIMVAWGIDKIAERFKDIHYFFIGIWLIIAVLNLNNFMLNFNHEISDSAYFLQNETINKTDINVIHTSTFSQTPYKVYLPNATHFLFTNLTTQQLFTAGGSVVEDDEIIRNITEVEGKNVYAISDERIFEKTIYEKGGLYVTKI